MKIVITPKNIIEAYRKAREKLEQMDVPRKDSSFYWKGKWRKFNRRNIEAFLKEVCPKIKKK